MPETPSPAARRDWREILIFSMLAYALAWAVWLPMAWTGMVVRAGALPTHFPGLLAPLAAALVTPIVARTGRPAWRALVRLDFGWRGWMLATAPGLLLGLFLVAAPWIPAIMPAGITRFSGLPELSLPLLFAIVLVGNGLGEEAGWRGFLLPRLQRRLGIVAGTLAHGLVWLGWHAPLFWVVATYRGMGPAGLVFGFGLGLLCGAFVLAHVLAQARGAILAVALWHCLYNFATATEVGAPVQAGISAVVMLWGLGLFARALAGPAGRDAIAAPASTKASQAPR